MSRSVFGGVRDPACVCHPPWSMRTQGQLGWQAKQPWFIADLEWEPYFEAYATEIYGRYSERENQAEVLARRLTYLLIISNLEFSSIDGIHLRTMRLLQFRP